MDNQKKMQLLEIIWAPWRMSYIAPSAVESAADRIAEPQDRGIDRLLTGADADCFLCQAATATFDEFSGRYIVGQSTETVTVLNRYPYNNGHLLVAPKRHIAELSDLTPGEWGTITCELTLRVAQLKRLLNADGFNLGLNLGRTAGAGLPGHLHWHIVPRWNGDTNFMTTVSGTKTIPQSLDALCRLISDDSTNS